MSNIQNKINLYVNFKKRIYDYTHYTYRHTFTFKQKQHYLSLYWQKYKGKIFNQKRIQKEKYEMKGETIIKKENMQLETPL